MTDIDFDELDRAVNSLVNPDNKAVMPAPTNAVPVASPSSTPTPQPATPSPATEPAKSPLAERRSSGRFMDVVHPSSDMRSSVPPRPTSRDAATINPPSTPTPAAPTPKPVVNVMPDPIDVHESTQAKAQEPTKETQPETPPSDAMTKPLESPFIADAKVEKRPLGAFSATNTEPTPGSGETPPSVPMTDMPKPSVPSDQSSSSTESEKSAAAGDQSIVNDTPMPAELQPGLLSIESNETPKSLEKEEETPVGPTSITQQYTQQPSTGDKPVANMFDTSAYKKPQIVTGKKKSGWLVVLWIFLLLVVGAGIGAAVYFFVLPRL